MASKKTTNSTEGSELERTLTLEELRIKHADVINNPAVQNIIRRKHAQEYMPSYVNKAECKPLGELIDEANSRSSKVLDKLLEIYDKSKPYLQNGI